MKEEKKLTRGFLVSAGFEREERGSETDFDGVEIVYHKDGIDLFDRTDDDGGFLFATYTRYPGRGFKGGFEIKTEQQLTALYESLTSRPLLNSTPNPEGSDTTGDQSMVEPLSPNHSLLKDFQQELEKEKKKFHYSGDASIWEAGANWSLSYLLTIIEKLQAENKKLRDEASIKIKI